MMNLRQWFGKVLGLLLISFILSGCNEGRDSYEEAMKYAEKGKYEKSLPYFKEAIEADGTEPDYYIGYGMALNRMAKHQEAGEVFSQIMKSDTGKSDDEKKQIYYGAALASYGQGDYSSAVKYAKKALKLNSSLSSMDSDIRYTETVALFAGGQSEKAEKLCHTVLKENDTDMELYMLYAAIKKAVGDSDGAIRIYTEAIRKKKDYYDAYFALYEQYLSVGQTQAADELLENMLSMKAEKASQMMAVGRAWYYKKDYDKAASYFASAYKKKEKKGLYYIALMKRMKGNLKDAEQDFLTYISEDKEGLIPEVYNQLAGMYMERSRYEQAQSMLTKGLAMGDTTAMQNLMRNQVILYELQGSYDKAAEAAGAYLKIYPADAAMKKELTFIQTRQ